MSECKHKITNVPSGFHFGTGAKFSYCAGPCPGKPVVHGTQNSTLSKPCQGTQNICIGVRKSECKHKITNVPSGFHFGTGAKFRPGKSLVRGAPKIRLFQNLARAPKTFALGLERVNASIKSQMYRADFILVRGPSFRTALDLARASPLLHIHYRCWTLSKLCHMLPTYTPHCSNNVQALLVMVPFYTCC